MRTVHGASTRDAAHRPADSIGASGHRSSSPVRQAGTHPFPTPIFLISAPRSGSQWLREILGCHPDIAVGPETYLFEAIARLVETVEWRSTRGQGIVGGSYVDRPHLARLCADFFLGAVRERAGGRAYFIDKTPANTAYVDLIHEVFPAARIIHLIRDGRDVVCSMLWARAQRGMRYPDTLRACAERWTQIRNALRFGQQVPELYTAVRYEQLVADAPGQLATLFTAIGIPVTQRTLQAMGEMARVVRHPSAATNKMGFIGKWRQSFSPPDVDTFKEVAGRLLIDLGYEPDMSWSAASVGKSL
jgi:hypothetical protein